MLNVSNYLFHFLICPPRNFTHLLTRTPVALSQPRAVELFGLLPCGDYLVFRRSFVTIGIRIDDILTLLIRETVYKCIETVAVWIFVPSEMLWDIFA